MIFDFLIFFFLFYTLDEILVRKTNINSLYFLNHFLHNIVICFLTYHNVIQSFDPKLQGRGKLHPFVLPMIYALHMYHIVCYKSFFRLDDWYHHILSMGVAVPLSLILFPSRNLLGFSFFMTTGIGGGINYLNLFLYKNGLMKKQTQQRINVLLNTWFRCPGIIINCGLILQYLSISELDLFRKFCGIIIFLILFWNGIYFQNIVVESFFLNLNK